MAGHHRAQQDDVDGAVGDAYLHLLADVADGHRVAGRTEAHAAEAVDPRTVLSDRMARSDGSSPSNGASTRRRSARFANHYSFRVGHAERLGDLADHQLARLGRTSVREPTPRRSQLRRDEVGRRGERRGPFGDLRRSRQVLDQSLRFGRLREVRPHGGCLKGGTVAGVVVPTADYVTPPRASKQEARAARGVSARWLSAKHTKRARLQASTAQNTDSDPIWPQSMTTMSPGAHTPGLWPIRESRVRRSRELAITQRGSALVLFIVRSVVRIKHSVVNPAVGLQARWTGTR